MRCIFVGGPRSGELVIADKLKPYEVAFEPFDPSSATPHQTVCVEFKQVIYRAKEVRLAGDHRITFYIADYCNDPDPIQVLIYDYIRLAEFYTRYKDYDQWKQQQVADSR